MDATNKRTLSEEIQSFLELIDHIRNDVHFWQEELTRTEQLTMDYLHQLELEETSYHDRAKIASSLMIARQQRREAKNQLEISARLLEFTESEQGKQLLNQLRQVLGATRKAEKLALNRSYMPRVLSNEEYFKNRKEDA